jgi:hypothetical protein
MMHKNINPLFLYLEKPLKILKPESLAKMTEKSADRNHLVFGKWVTLLE